MCIRDSSYTVNAKHTSANSSGERPQLENIPLSLKKPGSIRGTVMLTEVDNELSIEGKLEGFEQQQEQQQEQQHGFHVHESGEIGNSCKDAKGHYNPKQV